MGSLEGRSKFYPIFQRVELGAGRIYLLVLSHHKIPREATWAVGESSLSASFNLCPPPSHVEGCNEARQGWR